MMMMMILAKTVTCKAWVI